MKLRAFLIEEQLPIKTIRKQMNKSNEKQTCRRDGDSQIGQLGSFPKSKPKQNRSIDTNLLFIIRYHQQ